MEGGTSRGGFGSFWGANGRQTRPFGDEWDAGLGEFAEGAHKGRPYGWEGWRGTAGCAWGDDSTCVRGGQCLNCDSCDGDDWDDEIDACFQSHIGAPSRGWIPAFAGKTKVGKWGDWDDVKREARRGFGWLGGGGFGVASRSLPLPWSSRRTCGAPRTRPGGWGRRARRGRRSWRRSR